MSDCGEMRFTLDANFVKSDLTGGAIGGTHRASRSLIGSMIVSPDASRARANGIGA